MNRIDLKRNGKTIIEMTRKPKVDDRIKEETDEDRDGKGPSIETVVRNFRYFMDSYNIWRQFNGLGEKKIENVHEILTGMTDKNGRIARQIKHIERNDPKEDWPTGATMPMSGYLVYMMLLIDHYRLDITEGMIAELNESVQQHGEDE